MEKVSELTSHSSEKWDIHMMKIAKLCSEMSKDPSTKVGSVIMGPNKRILSTGYNGFPADVPDYKEWYTNREMKYKLIIHAEVNALKQLKTVEPGSTLYVYPVMPCIDCYRKIHEKGISRIVSLNHDKKHQEDNCTVCDPTKECVSERWESSLNESQKEMSKNKCEMIFIKIK